METVFEYLDHFRYLGLFIGLFCCGIGFPFPEDVIVIAGGYFAYLGSLKFFPMLVTLWAGAISGDITLYLIGRKFGREILAHRRLTWFFTNKRITTINHYFHRYGRRTLFFARFLIGLRSTIFLTTGAFKVPFRKVILFDGASVLVSVSAISMLAYHFGDKIDLFFHWVKRVEHALAVIIPLIMLYIGFKIYRHFKEEKEMNIPEEKELEPPPDATINS